MPWGFVGGIRQPTPDSMVPSHKKTTPENATPNATLGKKDLHYTQFIFESVESLAKKWAAKMKPCKRRAPFWHPTVEALNMASAEQKNKGHGPLREEL